MKTFVFILVVFCALMLGSVSWTSTAATSARKQKAVTQFDTPVTVRGVVLKGRYLFVHDDAAMTRGEACTYIYKGEGEATGNLVLSFHCLHIDRARTNRFTVRTREVSPGNLELLEFQFGGETAAHAVPTPPNVAVIPLAN